MPLLGVHCAACGVRDYRAGFTDFDYMRHGHLQVHGWDESSQSAFWAWLCPACRPDLKIARSEQDELPLAVES